jgi:hypothetical protein
MDMVYKKAYDQRVVELRYGFDEPVENALKFHTFTDLSGFYSERGKAPAASVSENHDRPPDVFTK